MERFDRLLCESATGQSPCGAQAASELRPLAQPPLGLGLETRQCVAGRLGRDSLRFEVGANPLVPVAARSQMLGPRAREPGVVEVSGAFQLVERLALRILGHAGARELDPQ